jgi:hypothetical protein
MATYAVIGPRELQQNITDMRLGTPAPITTLYTQIENAVDLAQDSVPISKPPKSIRPPDFSARGSPNGIARSRR